MNEPIPSIVSLLDFRGSVVIVTGGTKGVGRGIAHRFLEAGADVIVCGRSHPEEWPAHGKSSAHFVAADVREPEQIDAVVQFALDRFGRLDTLINNAGGSPPADAATASPRFSERIVQLNLLHEPFLVFRHDTDGRVAVVYKRDDGAYGLIETPAPS